MNSCPSQSPYNNAMCGVSQIQFVIGTRGRLCRRDRQWMKQIVWFQLQCINFSAFWVGSNILASRVSSKATHSSGWERSAGVLRNIRLPTANGPKSWKYFSNVKIIAMSERKHGSESQKCCTQIRNERIKPLSGLQRSQLKHKFVEVFFLPMK